MAFLSASLLAQAPTGAVHGQITDPSGAAVPAAKVAVINSAQKVKPGIVHADGTFDVSGLSPGSYSVVAKAKGFEDFVQANVQVSPGQIAKVDVALKIEEEIKKIEVQAHPTNVSVNPSENASSLVIKGEDLNALSDDPDELQSELQALAGPSAGPNGGQIYVDGFTAGQLPPKADILEIRINQNPFFRRI